MDNYSIIHDIDTTFISQNSWHIVLEKQLIRNIYLFKQHQLNQSKKKIKFNPKYVHNKIKNLIHQNIVCRLKKRKNSERNSIKIQKDCVSLSLRRKTEECPKKLAGYEIMAKKAIYIGDEDSNSLKKIYEMKKPRYFNLGQKEDGRFLPFQSSQVIINQERIQKVKKCNEILEKKMKNESLKSCTPKLKTQGKSILSLHQLLMDSKEVFPSQDLRFHKKVNHIQKLLIRTSFNSPNKKLSSPRYQKQMIAQKKCSVQLPEISRSNSKNKFISQFYKNLGKSEVDHQQQMNFLKVNLINKSQETRESDQQNETGIQSVISRYLKKSGNEKVQQVFDDVDLCKGFRNYRISKIKNVKFPVF